MSTSYRIAGGRRDFLKTAGCLTTAALLRHRFAWAQPSKVKIGLMFPYTGTYLGSAITNGFKLAIAERGGKLGGRQPEYFTVGDESDPAKVPENTNKLVQRDKVDVLIGTVHSGVALGMVKIARETGTLRWEPSALP